MKKTLLFLTFGFTVSLILWSCGSQKVLQQTDHNAKTSLDYDGIYRGTLPCADCEGIKTTVHLMRDGKYKLIQDYLGQKDATPFVTEGDFTWDSLGNQVSLKDGDQNLRFQVGENTLTQLGQDGRKATGALAKLYILTKDNYRILNRRWALIELMGKPVKVSDTKQAFIRFDDKTNQYTASAGCNSLSGTFSTEGFNYLTLTQGLSTMMACPDMTLEDELKQVLNTADAFQIDGDELILFKGRMAPMARFKASVN